MTEITKAKAKLWSRIGARAVFGQAILECAKERDDFYVLSADLAQSSGLTRFRSEFPERMINTGIAEQNMIGVAAGLAKDGTNVFATSFSPFVTMRACEQVRMNMGYMQLNIKTVGLGSGLIMAQLGNSHFGLEDGSMMRAIPGMTVVNPADGAAIIKTVEALCDFKGPVYLRLTGGPGLPIVYEEDFPFEIGKAISVREGKDISIIAAGTMVYYARKAAEFLAGKGIDAAVLYPYNDHEGAPTATMLEKDDPYNTRIHDGLPPTPICSPGLASIYAALYPESTNYYYYALDADAGVHRFFTNDTEFNNFVASQNYS